MNDHAWIFESVGDEREWEESGAALAAFMGNPDDVDPWAMMLLGEVPDV